MSGEHSGEATGFISATIIDDYPLSTNCSMSTTTSVTWLPTTTLWTGQLQLTVYVLVSYVVDHVKVIATSNEFDFFFLFPTICMTLV
jgi:hypothetical protein